MLKKIIILVLLILPVLSFAQQNESIEVAEMVFCSAIEDRQPAGIDSVFADTVGVVYCHTKIVGAADTTSIVHIWYFEDKEMARVELVVKSNQWRTRSSKRIIKEWAGNWKVDVTTASGELLKQKDFVIKSTAE